MRRKGIHPSLRRGRCRGSERGSTAVAVVAFLAGASLLATGLVGASLRGTRIASNEHAHAQALFYAEAAVEEARLRFSPLAPPGLRIASPQPLRPDWRAYISAGHPIVTDGDACNAGVVRSFDPGFSPANDNHCYMSVQSSMPWGLVKLQAKVDPRGTSVLASGLPVYTLTAWGTRGNERRQIELDLHPMRPSIIPDVVHAARKISLEKSSCIDSYNSSDGPYAYSGPGNCDPAGTAPVSVGTRLTLKGRARIYGDVVVGPTDRPAEVISVGHHAGISGSVTTAPERAEMPLPMIPAGLTCRAKLHLSGNSVRTLSEGVHCFSKLVITGNAQLTTTGAVKIYVTGDIKITGKGITSPHNTPAHLNIYSARTRTDDDGDDEDEDNGRIVLAGQSHLYATVYAPRANIKIAGNADLFGSVVGRSIALRGNAAIHFDEALEAIADRFIGFRRTNWREITRTGDDRSGSNSGPG
jgi:hypothetical protein